MIKKKFNFYFGLYLTLVFICAALYLNNKYDVGNDSTISEWLINYQGGYTRRGLLGELFIFLSLKFEIKIRFIIFLFQCFFYASYLFLLFYFLKNIQKNILIIFSIFSPLLIVYHIAEIEVLARKEILLFIHFLVYLTFCNSNIKRSIYLFISLPVVILIWEPVIFFFPFIFTYLIIQNDIEKFDIKFFKIIFSFIPSLIICFYIIFYPLSLEGHQKMEYILKNEFEELCYMSCSLLRDKSTLIQQFKGNTYSFEILNKFIDIYY